ncbi:MAG: hypothetical protein QOG26_707 [Solirubrobacterales bacterium]|jgi:hypothetical protein|nr:hypothetical protein [Solirubrobacterales bacterium]
MESTTPERKTAASRICGLIGCAFWTICTAFAAFFAWLAVTGITLEGAVEPWSFNRIVGVLMMAPSAVLSMFAAVACLWAGAGPSFYTNRDALTVSRFAAKWIIVIWACAIAITFLRWQIFRS